MIRLQIALDPTEADRLAALAASQLRDPRDQVRYILRRELERVGMLPDAQEPAQEEVADGHE